MFILHHPNGIIYFQVRYHFNGSPRKSNVGTYPTSSLSEARIKTHTLLKDVSNGIDPAVQKMKAKADKKLTACTTFEVICEERLALKKKHVTLTIHVKISGMIKANAYARLGQLPISEITSPMILQTLKITKSTTGIIKRRPRFLVDALALLTSDTSEGKIGLGQLGQYLKRTDPGFSPDSYGHSGLLNMVKTYELLAVRKETGGHYTENLVNKDII